MKDPHNYAHAGYGMIVVAASLAAIGIVALLIGTDVLFADSLSRESTADFNDCKAQDFKPAHCEKYWDRINTDVSGIYVDLEK
ncbi:MAG: hypothetical protein SCG72_00365 [Nitrosarchaeum sp.]|jgi:hypothetical protein|nr:hypothetical protein [Nitrosarchaeum sp.]